MGCRRSDRSHNFFSADMPGTINVPGDCRVSLNKAPWIPRPGEIITVEDDMGRHFRGRVLSLGKTQCEVHLFENLKKRMESSLDLLLLQSLPEKERMEWIIQKTTELGVRAIVPFHSERSIRLEEREKLQRKAHRWPDIAKKASSQCRRALVPVIEPYTSFTNALRYADEYDLKMLLWEREFNAGLKGICSNVNPPTSICVIVGPEGGFSEKEIVMARGAGFITVGLGPRILRTETAAITIIALIQYIWGDLG
ncbi:MAG: RsmE family RNA methyltransferase [bacterium]